jgi:metal-responsive CopG/Arc/MetJ family transcriptional regulator
MPCDSPPKATYVRLEQTLLARVDRFIEREAARQPGLALSRSDAIRILLHKGLDAEEAEEEPR